MMFLMKLGIIMAVILGALDLSAQTLDVTNTASITTNLFFYFRGGTNYHEHGRFSSSDWISYTIVSRDKKPELFRSFPLTQAFDLKMFDEAGKPVPKTMMGLSWTGEVKPPTTRREVRRLHGRPSGETYFLFRPDDLFVLTNKGIYDLEARLTIWGRTTNNVPDIEPWLLLQKTPIETNLHYGVVVSELLRVKIVKD
jgi:hypothetical protein